LWKRSTKRDILKIIRVSKRNMGSGYSSPVGSIESRQSTDPFAALMRTPQGSSYGNTEFSYPTWSVTDGWYGQVFFTVVVTLIILVIIHYTFFPILSFIPGDGGLIQFPIPTDRQVTMTQAPGLPDISANIVNLEPYNYTLSADVYLSGNFQASNMPRVILYRGKAPNTSLNTTDTKDKFLERFPDTNFIIWMDPIKNDLYVSIITGDYSSTANTFNNLRIVHTRPIENVPIRKVFCITVIFTQKFIEVYKDGLLQESMALKNSPIISPDNSYIFPTPAKALGSVMVSNVTYWRRVLTAGEVRKYGMPTSKETFFAKKT